MKIALIHKGQAYKPEIIAYQEYLQAAGYTVDVLKTTTPKLLDAYAIEWHFTGLDSLPKVPQRFKIHEYTSLSVPPFAKVKNQIKKRWNTKPDLRIFQNEQVRLRFGFRDRIPYIYRGPGIGKHFFSTPSNSKKEYDFVYLGAMDAIRRIDFFLQGIVPNLSNRTLLLIGDAPNQLQAKFKHKQVHFTGKIAYADIPYYLSKARFGLNLMPDIYPFNIQPSLKLLEYSARGLNIITSDYKWIRGFEQKHKARFYKLDSILSNFSIPQIEKFDYKTPALLNYSWEAALEQSNLLALLPHPS